MTTLAQLQIRYPVVRSVAVDVMHGLSWRQSAAKEVGHNESVLLDIPGGVSVRVARLHDLPVTTRGHDPSANSRRTRTPVHPHVVAADERRVVATIKTTLNTRATGDDGSLIAPTCALARASRDLGRNGLPLPTKFGFRAWMHPCMVLQGGG